MICTHCKQDKPLDSFRQERHACKKCENDKEKIRYKRNRKKILAKNKERYQRNREEILAKNKARYHQNAEKYKKLRIIHQIRELLNSHYILKY